MIFSVKKFWSGQNVLVTLSRSNQWFEVKTSFRMVENGGVDSISRAYDRFPSKFQNFERHCRNSSLFLVKCSFTAVALKILKTCMGAYRSLFLIEMSNAARNFSIEDGVYVARSQKSLKVGEKISVEKWKIMVLSKWALFFLRPCCNSTVSDIHYCIDTVSIQYRYWVDAWEPSVGFP